MNLSPLRDPQDLGLETFDRFHKARELKGQNIFPALLITSIEQLIIKKCFSFAFEVFFGLLVDVGENLGLEVAEETKLAMSEFTVSIQSKRLAVFRELQQKKEFYEVINGLGRIMFQGNDFKTLESAKDVLAELKVEVCISESFPNRYSRRTESVYVNLHVLKKGSFYLMLETEDFMDDEALEIEENQRIFALNELERLKREKIERKNKRREDRRKQEEKMMRDEEIYRFQYLKQEKVMAENEYFSLDDHEFNERSFVLNEMEDTRNIGILMEKQAKVMEDFLRKELKKQKNLDNFMKNQEKNSREFLKKCSRKCEKIKNLLEKEEKQQRKIMAYENEFQVRDKSNLQKQEKIVREFEMSVHSINSEHRKKLVNYEKSINIYNREELRRKSETLEFLKQEETNSIKFKLNESSISEEASRKMRDNYHHNKELMMKQQIIIYDHLKSMNLEHEQTSINESKSNNLMTKQIEIMTNFDSSQKVYKKTESMRITSLRTSLEFFDTKSFLYFKLEESRREDLQKNLDKEFDINEDFKKNEKILQIRNQQIMEKQEKSISDYILKLFQAEFQQICNLETSEAFQHNKEKIISLYQQNSKKKFENFEKSFESFSHSQSSLSSQSSKHLKSEKSKTKKYLEIESNLSKSHLARLEKESNHFSIFLKSKTILENLSSSTLAESESFTISIQNHQKTHSESIRNSLKLIENFSIFHQNSSKTRELKTIEILSNHEKFLKDFQSSCKVQENFQSTRLLKEFRQMIQSKKKEIAYSEKESNLLSLEERFARKVEYYQKLENKAEEEKKNAEDKYLAALKRIELQKIAEKQRQSKEKQLRSEREARRREEQLRYEQEEQLSPRGSEDSPDPPLSEESLIQESKLIEAMVLICGSFFCTNCYRMLKRSSLFLKCSGCCSSSFRTPSEKPKKEDHVRQKVPAGSICVGCNNLITRGELVMCICCYIRVEFLQDYSPPCCSSCMDAEQVDWVDTYIGSRFELIPCGFCSRLVNYTYVIEICTSCHDQICLHCLRKNHFLGSSVCNECHSRRSVNPYRKLPKSS